MHRFGLATLALAAGALAQDACNGFTELCDRKYSNITFAAAHNSEFVGKGPSHNQYKYPEQDMDMGLRYFTTQVHKDDDEIHQCHTDCALLDVGNFSDIVVSLKGWLDDNPREVVTLLIANGDNFNVDDFAPIFEDAGADKMAFAPDGDMGFDDWPTLGELIDSGKRFIVFMDYEADLSVVPYIMPQYDYYVETPFSPTSDNFFNCDVDRPDGGDADGHMVFANHDLNKDIAGVLVPDQDDAADTNSVDNIKKQTDICVSNYGRNPNVVMLDFVTEGEVIEAQKQLNGLS